MVDPISITASTLATTAMISTAIGGAISAAGAAYTGVAQSKMYDYQSSVAAINAKIAKQNADYERTLGEVTTQKIGLEEKARRGGLIAQQGASGVEIGSGSSQEVIESTDLLNQQRQATNRSDYARRAYNFDVEAMNKTAESGLYKAASSTSETSGFIKAAGSLISTGGSVADKWYTYKDAFGTA